MFAGSEERWEVILEAELWEALGQSGCPLCRLAHAAEQTYWTWFVLENYYSGPTLETLCRGGFCRTHAWRAAQLAGNRLAATYDVLARDAQERLRTALGVIGASGARVTRRRWRALLAGTLERKGPCPVCQTAAQRAGVGARHLVVLLAEEGGRARYAASDGLCWNHLVEACRLGDHPVTAFLVEDFLVRLGRLEEGLQEFFRKSDYRFAHEPKGSEQQAYLDAIERFSGPPDGVSDIAVPGRARFPGRTTPGA
ncbi:MAG: DUF6062 family protein [Bacillota bacterium]|nr:DUF6062 family protein [Bacillota bacterium]